MSLKKQISLLVVASDPSGFNNTLPVISTLAQRGEVQIIFVTTPQREEMLKTEAIDQFNLGSVEPIFLDQNDTASLDQLFDSKEINYVIGGQSTVGELEVHSYREANKRKIPNLSIIDYWSYYRERFRLIGDSPDMLNIPEAIITIDELCKNEMLELGFPESNLVNLGSPYFEKLFKSSETETEIHETFDSKNICFISSPRHKLNESPGWEHCGYDEFSALELLISELKTFDEPIKLTIKTHPREENDKFQKYIDESPSNLTICVDRDSKGQQFLRRFDLITGMDSIMLVEAVMYQLPVISIQPGLKGKDRLKTNQMNLSIPVIAPEEMKPALHKALNSKGSNLNTNELINLKKASIGATERIVDHMTRRLQTL